MAYTQHSALSDAFTSAVPVSAPLVSPRLSPLPPCHRNCPNQGPWPLLSPAVTSLSSSPSPQRLPRPVHPRPGTSILTGFLDPALSWLPSHLSGPSSLPGGPTPGSSGLFPPPSIPLLGRLVHSQGWNHVSARMTPTVLSPARASPELQIWGPANPQGLHEGAQRCLILCLTLILATRHPTIPQICSRPVCHLG